MGNKHILLIISFLCSILSDLRNVQFKDNITLDWTNETNHNNLNVDQFLGWLLVCEGCLAIGVTSGKRKNKQKIDIMVDLIRIFKYINLFDYNPDKAFNVLALTWIRFNVMLLSMGRLLVCEDCLTAGVALGRICTYRK